MSVPTSPSKASGEIADFITDINKRWSLDLPLCKAADGANHASRTADSDSVLSYVSFFIFRDRRLFLDAAVNAFSEQARTIFTHSLFKPGQDSTALPQRQRSTLPEIVPRDLTREQRNELIKALCLHLKKQREEAVAAETPSRGATMEPDSKMVRIPEPKKKAVRGKKPSEASPATGTITINSFFKPKLQATAASCDLVAPRNDKSNRAGAANTANSDAEEQELRKLMGASVDNFDTPEHSGDEMETMRATSGFFKKTPDTVPRALKKRSRSPEDSTSTRKTCRSSSNQASIVVPVNSYEKAPRPAASASTRTAPSISISTSAATSANTSFQDSTRANESFTTDETSISFASRKGPPQQPILTHSHCSGHHDPEEVKADEEMAVVQQVSVPVRPKALAIQDLPIEEYFEKHLFASSEFGELIFKGGRPSFRVLYETVRTALHTRIPAQNLIDVLTSAGKHTSNTRKDVWLALAGRVHSSNGTMPEMSKDAAWDAAGNPPLANLSLGGALKFNTSGDGPLLQLELRPLRLELSYRLKRQFGSHRFIHITIPSLDLRDLPSYLKKTDETAHFARKTILEWLLDRPLRLLGRLWRPFFSKPISVGTASRKSTKFQFNEPHTSVYFFAESGLGLGPSLAPSGATGDSAELEACTMDKMLSWYMDVAKHQHHNALKLYSRIALAVSPTTPTLRFKMHQIIRTDDAFAGDPFPRRLKKKSDKPKFTIGAAVMNDGCAMISRAAALLVAEKLGLQGQAVPSAFQGRLGGAKGLWFVDPSDDGINGKVWIEVTDSQLKFDWHDQDYWYPEVERLVFEVSKISMPPRAARLNYQLLPILSNRGVSDETIKKYIDADVKGRTSRAKAAKDSARSLACWTQDQGPFLIHRHGEGSTDWQGGAPRTDTGKMSLMLQSGFNPTESWFLSVLMTSMVDSYVKRLEDRMHIGISCSCYAFCVADPLGVLEEGEVHFGFSGSFRGEILVQKSGEDHFETWSDTMLDDMDVLVSRSPSNLVSDVQKVRAVFRRELASLKDVIVFSSKGKQPLADKLSGGDYDGDTVLVCWEPGLVDPFVNFPVPAPVPPERFGLVKDRTTIAELGFNKVTEMVRKGMVASLQAPMLGKATHYLENLNYDRWHSKIDGKGMEAPDAVRIGQLLGHLVDSAKAGLSFPDGQATFDAYLRSERLKVSYEKPAYRKGETPMSLCHPIDIARSVSKAVRQDVQRDLVSAFKEIGTYDQTLAAVAKGEEEEALYDPALKSVLDQLKSGLEETFNFWSQRAPRGDGREGTMKYGHLLEQTRLRFVELAPPPDSEHPVVRRWHRQHTKRPESRQNYWLLLKASTFFRMYQHVGQIPWLVCMRELCAIKAAAANDFSPVVSDIHDVLKVDTKLVRRLEAHKDGVADFAQLLEELEEDDMFGGVGDDEILQVVQDSVDSPV